MYLFFKDLLDYILERGTVGSKHTTIVKFKRQELLKSHWPFFIKLCTAQVIIGIVQIILQNIFAEGRERCMKVVGVDIGIALFNLLLNYVLFRRIKSQTKFLIIVIVNCSQAIYLIVISQYINDEQFQKQQESVTRLVYMILLDMVLINIQPLVLVKLFVFCVQYTFLAYYYEFNINNFGFHITIIASFFCFLVDQEAKLRRLLKLSELPKFIINSLSLPVFVVRCTDLSITTYNNMFKVLLLEQTQEMSGLMKQKSIDFSQIKHIFNQFENERKVSLSEILEQFNSQQAVQESDISEKPYCAEFKYHNTGIMDIRFQKVIYQNDDSILVTISEITNLIEKAKVNERTFLKSKLIKSMSHELRTRKNIIQGLLKIYLDQEQKELELIVQAYNNCIIESNIISSIINYNLCLENQLTINYQIYRIKSLIETVIQYFKYDLDQKRINVIYNIDPELYLSTDIDLFQQIITNIINNSIKYANPQCTSYIQIQATREHDIQQSKIIINNNNYNQSSYVSINGDYPINESYIMIKIIDNGFGIKQDQLKIISDIMKNDNIQTPGFNKADGFYLGLRSCNQLLSFLNKDNQNIVITSRNGQFTEVYLKFKIFKAQASSSEHLIVQENTGIQEVKRFKTFQATHNKIQCGCRETVLVVDDEPFNLFILKDIISQFGLKIQTASNGYEAYQIVKKYDCQNPYCSSFFAIFMDYQMPIMNGVDATKAIIKYQKQYKKTITPIIGCTAFSASEDINELKQAGMIRTLIKPINKLMIKEVLNYVQLLYDNN